MRFNDLIIVITLVVCAHDGHCREAGMFPTVYHVPYLVSLSHYTHDHGMYCSGDEVKWKYISVSCTISGENIEVP